MKKYKKLYFSRYNNISKVIELLNDSYTDSEEKIVESVSLLKRAQIQAEKIYIEDEKEDDY